MKKQQRSGLKPPFESPHLDAANFCAGLAEQSGNSFNHSLDVLWSWETARERHAQVFSPAVSLALVENWKRLKGRNTESKNFRKLLRRKQSSAKISKISRNTINSSKSDIFYLLRNLLKYLLRTFSSSAKFSEVFCPLRFYPLALSEICATRGCEPRHSLISCRSSLLLSVFGEPSSHAEGGFQS